jgi:phage-related minor tail protein
MSQALRSIASDFAKMAPKYGEPSLFSALFGASATPANFFGLLPGHAAGGPVPAGQLSVIGEKGPELFIPQTRGYILPNSALKVAASGGTPIAASGNTNNITISPSITVNASGGTQAQNADLAKQTSDAMNRHFRAIVSDVLIEQQCVGGILRPGLGARLAGDA